MLDKERHSNKLTLKKIVQYINEKYINEKKKTPKILVRGMSELGVWTLKAYEDPIDDMFEDYQDYLSGRVTDTGKFQNFYQVEISLYS